MKNATQATNYNNTLRNSVNNKVWLFITPSGVKSLDPISANDRRVYFLDLTGKDLQDYRYMIANSIDIMN